MERFMTSVEVGAAVFPFLGPDQCPEGPCPCYLSRGGGGTSQLVHVGVCVSLLTLQQKWEEPCGLPGISWGGEEDI